MGKLDALELINRIKTDVANNCGNANGSIDTEDEVSIFEQKLSAEIIGKDISQDVIDEAMLDVAKDDKAFAQIFGLETTVKGKGEEIEVVNQTPPVTSPMNRGYASFERVDVENISKSKRTQYMNVLKQYTDNKELATTMYKQNGAIQAAKIVEILYNAPELQGVKDEDDYMAMMNKTALIIQTINEIGYSSKKDVESLEKKVKERLNLGKNDKFAKELVKVLVKNAEIIQRTREFEEMKARYQELTSDKDKEGNPKTPMQEEDAYKQVKSEFNKSGSYHKDYLKHGNFFYKLTHMRRHLSAFEKEVIIPEETKEYNAAMEESRSTKGKNVRKDAKNILGQEYNYYHSKISGDKMIKEASDAKAIDNKVDNIKESGLTEQEINKAVGKKSTFGSKITFGALFKKNTNLFESLRASGLITEKDGGKYDVSKLSDLIRLCAGSDGVVNSQDEGFKALSEQLNTEALAEVAGLLDKLDQKEVKMLVEMCGFKWEGKNWMDVIKKTAVGTLIGAAGGAIGTLTNPRDKYERTIIHKGDYFELNLFINSKETVNSILNSSEAQNIQNIIPGAAVNTLEGQTGIQIIIKEEDQIIPLKKLFSKHIGATAFKSAIVGTALGLLEGLLESNNKKEIPFITTTFDCMEASEFSRWLDKQAEVMKLDPKVLQAIRLIFKAHTEEGPNGELIWDEEGCEGLRAELIRIAGAGSVLNRAELARAKSKYDAQKPEEPVTPPSNEDPEPDVCYADLTGGEKNDPTPVTVETRKLKKGQTWDTVVKAYYNCLIEDFDTPEYRAKYPKIRGTISGRVFKLAQAITDGDYSKERMDALLVATTGKSKAQIAALNISGFDVDKYWDILTNPSGVTAIRVPSNIAGCEYKADAEAAVGCKPVKGSKAAYNQNGYSYNVSNRDNDYTVTMHCDGKQVKIGAYNTDGTRKTDAQVKQEAQQVAKENGAVLR